MSKNEIDPAIIQRGLVTLADNIVNPRCDECGRSVNPRNRLNGPHLCMTCAHTNEVQHRADMVEFLRSQYSTRRVHVVKLPENLIKAK